MDTLYSVIVMIGSLIFPASSSPSTSSSSSASPSPAPAVATDQGGAIGEKFAPYLEKLTHHTLVPIDPNSLSGVKYYAVYYSASWCPPCRAFTPSLVEFYNSFKPTHPNFELIFVCDDRSSADMVNYMKMDDMPWTAVSYSNINNASLNATKWEGSGIPDLVLIDSNGTVLSDSFSWGSYVGPQKVVEDIKTMVPTP